MKTKIVALMSFGFIACITTAGFVASTKDERFTDVVATLSPQSQKHSRLPHGQIIYSANSETVMGYIRSDLFLQDIPSGKINRLTTAHSSLLSGGDIQQPKFSPDGRQVVFLDTNSNVPKLERSMYMGHAPTKNIFLNLWQIDVASGKTHLLTHRNQGWYGLYWSPDGASIAAVHTSQPRRLGDNLAADLYVFNSRTWRGHSIAHSPGPIFNVYWSSDSRFVLYQPLSNQIDRVPRWGGKAQLQAQGGRIITGYSLSPSGQYAAFAQDNTLLLVRDAGGQTISIIRLPGYEKDLARGPCWSQPVWSHDGCRIAVAEAVTNEQHKLIQVRIRVLDTSGHGSIVAALPSGTMADASILGWSRDGSWLIVTSNLDFAHNRLLAISTRDGSTVTLKMTTNPLHGIDWHETASDAVATILN